MDTLFLFLCGIALFFVSLIAFFILFFAIRYRRSVRPKTPERVAPNRWLEALWIVVPLAINLVIFTWAAKLYLKRFSTPPENAYEIYVVGKQWMWKFQHADGRREINELHVPQGRPVRLIMISQDVIHSLFLPALRIKHDVLPMRYSTLWFEATRPGAYHIFCAEYCGAKHSKMTGTFHVLSPEKFAQWKSSTQGMGSPASEGKALLQKLGCRSCHRTDSLASAPRLETLYGGKVILQDGSAVTADDDYIRRSLLLPSSQIVARYQPVMPSYQGLVTEDQILQILAYLKSEARRDRGQELK